MRAAAKFANRRFLRIMDFAMDNRGFSIFTISFCFSGSVNR